ncbi:MAG: Rpn family recombination-promoting nuclease/putative transposase [Roseburia sp.]|nr:Rpn family recombination-promoting nuclease/putative transposase [Roseburia sp.]
MNKDISWKGYLDDNDRYADIINGVCCEGRQTVAGDDLEELDTQTGFIWKPLFMGVKRHKGTNVSTRAKSSKNAKSGIKIRDTLRKAAFGVNFAIIGIENQESTDYSIPLRNMSYDAGEYERQAAKIRRVNKKNNKGLSTGEYLYGFRKEDRLHPVVTLIIYSGEEEWSGPVSLHEIIDFTDIPESLKSMVHDYRINLVEIRKLTDTSVFKTDVRQVFDFIRYSGDKDALKNLIEGDDTYKSMEEDAYDVVAHYVNAPELVEIKDDYYGKDGKVDMCKALKELMEDSRKEGRAEGREEGVEEGIEKGLRALVLSLSLLLPSLDAVHQAVINNEDYRNVSREQVKKYYR